MKSIKYKILAIAIIPLLIIATILTASHIHNRTSDAEYKLIAKIETMTRAISSSLEYGIVSGNEQYVTSLLNDFVRSNETVKAVIYNDEGNILYKIGRNPNQDDKSAPEKLLNIKTDIFRSVENINDYSAKDDTPAPKIATLNLTISTKSLEKEKNSIIIESVIITSLLLTITIITVLTYIQRITVPFRKMLHGIDTIREGNIGYQLESPSILELDALARHVNKMSSALKDAQDQLVEKSDNELYVERSKALVTLESIGEGVITTDREENITYMNPAAELLTSAKFHSVKGKNLHKVFRVRSPEATQTAEYPVKSVVNNNETLSHDPHLLLVRPDNSEIVIKDTASPIQNKNGEVIGMALVFHDFSSIKHMSDMLAYQASHDDLTELYNRREFESQLDDALRDASERNTEHALCYLDLDQFKIINDTCGHMAGDILLKQISQQIKNRIRRHDLLARLGGDEFGIIFYDINIKEAKELAQLVKNSVADFKYIWHNNSFDIGVSIGLVPINNSVKSHSELLMRADSACYIAKDNGRNCIHIYAPSDRDFIRRCDELQWYNRITDALDNSDFELHCQAVRPVGSHSSQHDRYEILLRMLDSDKIILPSEFIPAAERYLLMPRIDRWVIDSFLWSFEKMALEDFLDIKYNINLSGQSLCNDEFLEYVVQKLQGRYVKPENLTFEITETAAISNLDKALTFIRTLKEFGCEFALDDFGTGVSSFQYLHDLPVDYIKIDGKFVRNIDSNQINHSIINAITDIGHELGLEIIAEYVEDDAILKKLSQCNIDYLQGFAVGKPFPLQQLINTGA